MVGWWAVTRPTFHSNCSCRRRRQTLSAAAHGRRRRGGGGGRDSLYISTGNAVDPNYNQPHDQPKPGDFFEGVFAAAQVSGGPSLQVVDHYRPTWAKSLNDNDLDFGGSSPIVLPPIGGKTFVVTTAKDGNIYLLDKALPGFGGELWTSHNNGGLFSSESKCAPAYFHDPVGGGDYVYVVGSGSPGLVAFKVDAAKSKLVKAWDARLKPGDGPGSPFILSEPVSNQALVWSVDGIDGATPVLRASDALSGALVFHSDAVAGNGFGETNPHFAPVSAGAQSVFVGTVSSVVCYTNVPPTLTLIVVQSTFGQNEVELGLPGTSSFSLVGYVQLDGFKPSDIGNLAAPAVADVRPRARSFPARRGRDWHSVDECRGGLHSAGRAARREPARRAARFLVPIQGDVRQ